MLPCPLSSHYQQTRSETWWTATGHRKISQPAMKIPTRHKWPNNNLKTPNYRIQQIKASAAGEPAQWRKAKAGRETQGLQGLRSSTNHGTITCQTPTRFWSLTCTRSYLKAQPLWGTCKRLVMSWQQLLIACTSSLMLSSSWRENITRTTVQSTKKTFIFRPNPTSFTVCCIKILVHLF